MQNVMDVQSLVHTQMGMQDVSWLANEIRERKRRRSATSRMLDAHMKAQFGIEDFTRKIDAWMPPAQKLHICMGRQIPTWSVEGLGLSALSSWLAESGIPNKAEPLAFTRDCFGRHGYKDALVNLREIRWAQGRLQIRGRKLLDKEHCSMLQKRPILKYLHVRPGHYWMKAIEAGTSLMDFHYGFRQACLPAEDARITYDASSLFESMVRECLLSGAPRQPSHIYIEENRCDRRIDNPASYALNGQSIRPCALWYYHLYMSMFVTGDRALIASLDDDESVHEMFSVMHAVEEACGVQPLIVWVPYQSETMMIQGQEQQLLFNELNPHVLEGDWRSKITMPNTDRPFDAMKRIEHQIINIGKE